MPTGPLQEMSKLHWSNKVKLFMKIILNRLLHTTCTVSWVFKKNSLARWVVYNYKYLMCKGSEWVCTCPDTTNFWSYVVCRLYYSGIASGNQNDAEFSLSSTDKANWFYVKNNISRVIILKLKKQCVSNRLTLSGKIHTMESTGVLLVFALKWISCFLTKFPSKLGQIYLESLHER